MSRFVFWVGPVSKSASSIAQATFQTMPTTNPPSLPISPLFLPILATAAYRETPVTAQPTGLDGFSVHWEAFLAQIKLATEKTKGKLKTERHYFLRHQHRLDYLGAEQMKNQLAHS